MSPDNMNQANDQDVADNGASRKSWKETFFNAAKASGLLSARFAILAGTFLTGAGFAFTMTNMHNKNEKQIIDSATSSNPAAPITVSDDVQIILSDTNLTVISHGIPCDIPLDGPSTLDITLGNTGEATVSEATSILQTLGITSDSKLNKSPSDNAEAILRLRHQAAAACRADILKAQQVKEAGITNAEQPVAQNAADYPAPSLANE